MFTFILLALALTAFAIVLDLVVLKTRVIFTRRVASHGIPRGDDARVRQPAFGAAGVRRRLVEDARHLPPVGADRRPLLHRRGGLLRGDHGQLPASAAHEEGQAIVVVKASGDAVYRTAADIGWTATIAATCSARREAQGASTSS